MATTDIFDASTPHYDGKDKAVQTLLDTHEKELRNKVPSFLSKDLSKFASPSKIFSDYRKTGDPIFKKTAGHALDILKGYVDKIQGMNAAQLLEVKRKSEEKPIKPRKK